MNPLDPIRHAYGDAEGPPPVPGEPGYAEYRLLRSTREALDVLPRERPDAEALAAVKAAVAAYAHEPLRAAYGEAEPPADDDPRHAEYLLLKGTREALDRTPKVRPDASVIDAVVASVREATPLAPLLHVYGEAEGAAPAPAEPGYAEYALLKGAKEALDALPRLRPDAATLDAVKAAVAAHALGPVKAAYDEVEPPAVTDPRHAEYVLLRSTREVLSRAPKARPDAATLAAVTAAASVAGTQAGAIAPPRAAAPRPAAGSSPAADRQAERRVHPFPRIPAWVGMAAMFVIVATAGIWMLNERPEAVLAPETETAAVPPVEEQTEGTAPAEDQIAEAAPGGSDLTTAPETEQSAVLAVPSPDATSRGGISAGPPGVGPLIAPPPPRSEPVPSSTFRPARPAAPPPAEPVRESLARAAGRDLAARAAEGLGLTADEEAVPVATWETGEDVRLLSLRLQQMAETNGGLSWDAPPAPFGAAGATGGARLEGVQTVGEGFGPARVEVRMRTTPSDRSDGQ